MLYREGRRMAMSRTLVKRGGWMLDRMFDRETGEALIVIEAEGTFREAEAEHFIEVLRRVMSDGDGEGEERG